MQGSDVRQRFFMGCRAGIPIALGYLACSLSLGIRAAEAGLSPLAATLCSLCLNASAGEYALFTSIEEGAPLLACVLMVAIANARYFLMSSALSTKLSPRTGLLHRAVMGFDLTDELFCVSIGGVYPPTPAFYYGMMTVSVPAWALGTYLGALVGTYLPAPTVDALGMALFGMFLTSVIPAARGSRTMLLLVTVSMTASFVCSVLPLLSQLSESVRTVLLTVAVAALFAYFCPIPEAEDATEGEVR